MIINHTDINYVPAATGNQNNLNEVVTDPNLDRWFIDHSGRAICLTKISGNFENTSQKAGILQRTPDNEKKWVWINQSGNLNTTNKQ